MVSKLQFYLDNFHHLTAMPVHCLELASGVTLLSRGFADRQNPFEFDAQLLSHIRQHAQGISKPKILFENGIFAYGLYNDNSENLIIIGPVLLGSAELPQLVEYARLHNMHLGPVKIKSCALGYLLTSMINICYALCGQMLSENDVLLNQDNEVDLHTTASYQTYIISNTEKEVTRTSYSSERDFIRLVREGDVESVLAFKNSSNRNDFILLFEERMGLLAINKIKHFEYMTCVSIALYCRAAIESGMDASVAYALSDLYLQRLEKCWAITEMVELSLTVQLDYTKEVRRILNRQNRSSYVEKAKSFIANHLSKPFTLDDVADAAGISKPYLAELFSEQEGVGVMEYARIKRIEAAANMLKYSDESLSTIASFLCFHSQSHFGARFKSITGVTPHQYREMHCVIDVEKRIVNN